MLDLFSDSMITKRLIKPEKFVSLELKKKNWASQVVKCIGGL